MRVGRTLVGGLTVSVALVLALCHGTVQAQKITQAWTAVGVN